MPTSIYDIDGLDSLQRDLRLDPRSVRKLRNDWLKHFTSDEAALRDFPAAAQMAPRGLTLFKRCDSQIDGASKLLLRTNDGLLVESVVMRLASGRTTLCVSSQVGCAAGCGFCATGKMGIIRNLSADDILDQVLRAGQLLTAEARVIRNIVFMGMGEPFHNEKNLHRALEALTSPRLFNHSPGKILVSTVGIPDAMLRCAKRFPKVKYALSLHSVKQAVRERLIPLARKYSLGQLRGAIMQINQQGAAVMIEYLLLGGMNDSPDDAVDLIAWLDGLNVHVNLIPFNSIADAPHLTGSDRETRRSFAGTIKAAGIKTTIRYSLGADIAAACGQLARSETQPPARTLLNVHTS